MSGPGGAREGAGRKAGGLNRRSQELVDAASSGLSPFDYMLQTLRDETADKEDRQWAAEKLAPFLYPRPAPQPRSVRIDLPATDTAEGVTQAFAALIAAVGAGELAPAEAQSLSALIEAQRKAIETSEILARMERLEADAGRSRPARPRLSA